MLPETVRELAQNHRVAAGVLFEFEFASGTKRFWDGTRELTSNGHVWEASGDIISVSGIGSTTRMNAQPVTFQMSGVSNDLMRAAVEASLETIGRGCSVYLQFLNSERSPLDAPIVLWTGTMDLPTFRADVRKRSISMSCENLFVDRVRAPYGLQTDSDQQARWPGDLGYEFMPTLLSKTVNWLRS